MNVEITQETQTMMDNASCVFAVILVSILIALLIFLFICNIFEEIRQKQFLDQANEQEKKILLDYISIEKNPFKKVKKQYDE